MIYLKKKLGKTIEFKYLQTRRKEKQEKCKKIQKKSQKVMAHECGMSGSN
jgi:hypothetical protein